MSEQGEMAMIMYSVTDAAFAPYGKILEGYDTAPLT